MRPDALEMAAGTMLGRVETPTLPASKRSVRDALEGEIRRALARPPCVVTFSGGRDSSAILALATAVARREGFADPIPATLVFPGDVGSDEASWQELVIGAIRPAHWERISCGPELEVVGPVAREVAKRHGLLFPSNAYLHEPLIRVASGGSILPGIGGDEMFDSPAPLALRIARGYEPFSLLTAKRLTRRVFPERGARAAARLTSSMTWLTDDARAAAQRRADAASSALGHHWGRAIRRWPADRYYLAAMHSIRSMAAFHDTLAIVPFIEPPVLAAIAEAGGFAGFRSRADAMRRFFSDVLPDAVLDRQTKAIFDSATFGAESRALASSGLEAVLDTAVVHPTAVRAAWLSERGPDARTLLLLQHAAFGVDPD